LNALAAENLCLGILRDEISDFFQSLTGGEDLVSDALHARGSIFYFADEPNQGSGQTYPKLRNRNDGTRFLNHDFGSEGSSFMPRETTFEP
jgi:hypothetical protein